MGTKSFDTTLPSPFGTRVNFLPLNNLGPILLIAGGSISFTNLVPKDIFLANWIHRIRTAYSARGSLFPHAWRGLSARRHRNDTQKSPIFSVTSAGDRYPSRRAVQRALCTFTGKGQPQASLSRTGQEFAPNSASYGRYLNKRFLTRRVNLNTLKFSSGPKGAQSSRNPAWQDF